MENNRLLGIDLAGYRSIAHAELDFRSINLLIGANGAGKSNLISFFRLLSSLCSGNLQSFVGEELGGASSALHFGAKRTKEIEAKLTFAGKAGENRYHMRLVYGAGDRLLFAEEDIQYRKNQTAWETAPIYSLGAGHFESLLRGAKKDVEGRDLPKSTPGVILHLMANWRVFQFHDTSKTARIKQSYYADNKDYLWSDAGNLAAHLLFLRETTASTYKEIIDTIRRVLPAFGDFVLSAHPATRNVTLNWSHKGSDEVFGPHQISDGSLRFMALATLLLQDDPPPLILLDEPELGLHPFAVEILAALLRSASKVSQVVISTQSVALANQFQPEDIVVVDHVGNASRFTRLAESDWAEWLKDYGIGDLWAKNLIGGTPE
jgi:predicted ATPase